MPATTPQQVLENVMAPLLLIAAVKARAEAINKIFQWSITGPNGGDWVVDCTVGNVAIRQELNGSAKVTYTCTDEDFMKMASGRLKPSAAVTSGQLQISGDMGISWEYPKIFPAFDINA